MPHATASVNGVVVAETDKWEVVDGNIYVGHSHLLSSPRPDQYIDAVPTGHHHPVPLQPYLY
jgi:hypothetical protein